MEKTWNHPVKTTTYKYQWSCVLQIMDLWKLCVPGSTCYTGDWLWPFWRPGTFDCWEASCINEWLEPEAFSQPRKKRRWTNFRNHERFFFPQHASVSRKMLPIINYHQLTVEWFRNPANHHQLREVGSEYPLLHPRVLGSSQDLTFSVLPRKLWKGRTDCIFLVTCGYGKEG